MAATDCRQTPKGSVSSLTYYFLKADCRSFKNFLSLMSISTVSRMLSNRHLFVCMTEVVIIQRVQSVQLSSSQACRHSINGCFPA